MTPADKKATLVQSASSESGDPRAPGARAATSPDAASTSGAASSGGTGTRDTAEGEAGSDAATPPRPGYSARKKRPAALRVTTPPAPASTQKKDPSAEMKPIAGPAKLERRHRGVMLSFLLLVLLPVAATAFYLWVVAKDQYASTVAFSIRKGELSSSLDLLGGQIAQLGGGGGAETDLLYEFIRSQELVADIDRELGLEEIYSAAWPWDPVFAYNPRGTIEDLVRHWKRKVQITYDTGNELMTLRVLAFEPDVAQSIAQEILDESTTMINALSDDAREDATRYAQEEVDRAIERLKDARSALTAFRLESQIVDPSADLQGQMGVLNSLQSQLADALVELDLLQGLGNDPRIQQLERRIEVIEKRIAAEREKFGLGGQGPGGEDYVTIVAEFERLSVDREFAEETYRAALVNYDAALAEAKRKSFYLAAHIQPTRAERSDYPRRWTLLGLSSFFLLLAWSIGVLIYYSVRDRR